VGSHLVNRLLDDGWTVDVVDNLRTGKRENVNERATFHQVDLTSSDFGDALDGLRPEVVFHLAAQASVVRSMEDPADDVRINVSGTLNLLKACERWPIRHFVFTSTGGAIYGEPVSVPCDEDHPAKPLSVYGASKLATEGYLRVLAGAAGFPYTVLRPGNIYGPRQDPHGEAGVIAIFANRMLAGEPVTIFGDGSQERDYVYVDDIVEANLRAVSSDRGVGGPTFNLGTGIGTSVLTIFELLVSETGYQGGPTHAPARTGEVQRIYLDASRAERELGWRPQVSFEDGIQRTVEALKNSAG
jgi:UDP-glucose 4-epimerase